MESISEIFQSNGQNFLDHSYDTKIVLKLIFDIQKEENRIIIEKIKEILEIDLNIEEEKNRMFKRFFIRQTEDTKTVYFNDGSVNGKRIVTFMMDKKYPLFKSNEASIQMNVQYY